eukprot:8599232-Pyramimonas_sp.AAC.2
MRAIVRGPWHAPICGALLGATSGGLSCHLGPFLVFAGASAPRDVVPFGRRRVLFARVLVVHCTSNLSHPSRP